MPPKKKDKKVRPASTPRSDSTPASYCSLFDRISNHNVDLGLLIVKACLTSALVGRGKIFIVPPKSEIASFSKLSRDELSTSLKNYILKGNLALKDFIDGKMIFSLNFDHGYNVSVKSDKGGKVSLNGVELSETASLNGMAGSQGGYIYFVDKALKPTKQSRQSGGAIALGDDLTKVHIKANINGVKKNPDNGTTATAKDLWLDAFLPKTHAKMLEILQLIKDNHDNQKNLQIFGFFNAIGDARKALDDLLTEELLKDRTTFLYTQPDFNTISLHEQTEKFLTSPNIKAMLLLTIVKEITDYLKKNIYSSRFANFPLLETSLFSYINFIDPTYFFDILRGPMPSVLNWNLNVDNGWMAYTPPPMSFGGSLSGLLYEGSWYPDANLWSKYIKDYFLSPFFLYDGHIDLVPKVEQLLINGDFLGVNDIFYPMFYDSMININPYLVDMFGPVYGMPASLLATPTVLGNTVGTVSHEFLAPAYATPFMFGGTLDDVVLTNALTAFEELSKEIENNTGSVEDLVQILNQKLTNGSGSFSALISMRTASNGKDITTWSNAMSQTPVFLKTVGQVKPEYRGVVLLMQWVARYICYSLHKSQTTDPVDNKNFSEVCSETLAQSIVAGGFEGFMDRLKQFTTHEEQEVLMKFIAKDLETKIKSLEKTEERLFQMKTFKPSPVPALTSGRVLGTSSPDDA